MARRAQAYSADRMQWESYPSFWRCHPKEAQQGLKVFIWKAKQDGLTQIEVVREDSMIVVIATLPGDPTGKEVFY